MRVLVAGCGYLGQALGARLVADGHAVAGIRRPGSDPAPLRAIGVMPLAADLARRDGLEGLPRGWDWVVHCAAPAEGGEEAYRAVYREGARNLVDWLRDAPPRGMVFTGSTRVYGQRDGSWVTEAAPAEPTSAAGRILREAEDLWRSGGGVALRVAGIYGPGRNRLGALFRGEARIQGDGRRHLNLVQRDDLVAAVLTALARGLPGAVYNVSDGQPPTEGEFYAWLCSRLGRPPPPVADEAAGGGAGRRVESDKRIDSRRIREELGWQPLYPSFREGYAPLLEERG